MDDQRQTTALTVRRASSAEDWRDATTLVREHVAWMRQWTDFDPVDVQPVLAIEMDGLERVYDRADAAVFVARRRGAAVGVVVVCMHADRSAEVKRMFVRPSARGPGVADQLVKDAVAAAERWGCRTVWLETVGGSMDAAISVYHRHGFVVTAPRDGGIGVDGALVMERPIDVVSPCP